jgi:hypothetical protein
MGAFDDKIAAICRADGIDLGAAMAGGYASHPGNGGAVMRDVDGYPPRF